MHFMRIAITMLIGALLLGVLPARGQETCYGPYNGRQLSTAELDKVLEEHVWWQSTKTEGQRADLCGAILTRANLEKRDLSGVNFHGAILASADLHEAYLPGVDLRWIDMRGG